MPWLVDMPVASCRRWDVLVWAARPVASCRRWDVWAARPVAGAEGGTRCAGAECGRLAIAGRRGVLVAVACGLPEELAPPCSLDGEASRGEDGGGGAL